MVKYYLILLLCLVSMHLAQAQCDYNALMKEGRALYQKQQFRAAIKKFNAARICDGSRSAEVDREVDRVFDAIEGQRDEAKAQREEALLQKQRAEDEKRRAEESMLRAEIERGKASEAQQIAEKMRDSVSMANENKQRAENQKAAFIESNDLHQLGDSYKAEKNYTEAIAQYQKALNLLDAFPEKDAALTGKYDIIQRSMEDSKQIVKNQLTFEVLMSRADSNIQAGIPNYTRAFENYFEAIQTDFDSTRAIRKLLDLEILLGDRIRPRKQLKGYQYYELLAKSAETNMLLGNLESAKKRIRSILRLQPPEIGFIQNPTLNEYATKESKRLVRRLEIAFGMKAYFFVEENFNVSYSGRSTPPSQISLWFIGMNASIGKRSGVSLEISSNTGIEPNWYDFDYDDSREFNLNEISFAYNYKILKTRSKRWGSENFNVQAIGGLTLGRASDADVNQFWNYMEIESPIIYESLLSGNPDRIITRINKSKFEFEINRLIDVNKFSIYISDDFNNYLYLNGFAGLRVQLLLIPQHRIYFLGECVFTKGIYPSNEYDSYNIQGNIVEIIGARYNLPDSEKNQINAQLSRYYLYANEYEDLILTSGLTLKLGFAYRF